MRILCLDASTTEFVTWALFENDQILIDQQVKGRASSVLFENMNTFSHQLNDLDKILVGVGPGSFSGIRITIACAQAVCLAQKKCEIIAIPSTHSIAWDLQHISYLGVFVPGRQNEYFVVYYKNGIQAKDVEVIKRDDLDHHLSKCTKTVSTELINTTKDVHIPQASSLIQYYSVNKIDLNLPLQPIYL